VRGQQNGIHKSHEQGERRQAARMIPKVCFTDFRSSGSLMVGRDRASECDMLPSPVHQTDSAELDNQRRSCVTRDLHNWRSTGDPEITPR
jgi:hypothetical protein